MSETKDTQAEGQMKNEDEQDKAHGSWLREEVTTFVQDWRHSSVRTNVRNSCLLNSYVILQEISYIKIEERKTFILKNWRETFLQNDF